MAVIIGLNIIFLNETLMRQVQFSVWRLKDLAWVGYIYKFCYIDIRREQLLWLMGYKEGITAPGDFSLPASL